MNDIKIEYTIIDHGQSNDKILSELKALNIIRTIESHMTTNEIIEWNELYRNRAPKDVRLAFAEKKRKKYSAIDPEE